MSGAPIRIGTNQLPNPWSLRRGRVWSIQRSSPKSKRLATNSHSLSTWTTIVWSLQSPNPKEHSTLCLVQINPSNLTAKILSMFDFLMKRNWQPLGHIWASVPVRPKLPSRVRHLRKKVSILNCDGLWTLALVWRVERANSWFLATCLVKIDNLSTLSHSVKPTHYNKWAYRSPPPPIMLPIEASNS